MMKKLVIALNILFVIIGLFSILLALTSFMVFDAPGSENNLYLWGAFFAAIVMPFACFGSVIASVIVLYKYNNFKNALIILLLPCVVIIIFIVCLLLIQIFCHGDFSCPEKFAYHHWLNHYEAYL